jgi:PAS domain S-box-containing protein
MTRAVGSASPMLRLVATTAAFASLYFLAATLTGSLTGDSGIAVLWPASGVYLGVMLVAPRHLWPALACAAGVGSLAAYLHAGSSLEVSVAFAVPSSAEGLLGALLVERIAGKRFTLGGLHDVFALVLGGAVVANALVALSAGAVAAQTFDASFAESWLRWWSADALGVIAVAPIITASRRPWGPRAVALGGLGVALVATYVASRGSDLVAYAGSAGDQIYITQAFLAVLLLSSLAFAAAVTESDRLREELRRANAELERRRIAVDQAGDELEGTAERLDEARQRVAHLTAELAARSAELYEAARRRERLADDVRNSQVTRVRTEQELGAAKSALAVAEQQLERLGRELAVTVTDRDRVKNELDESARALGRLQAEFGDAAGELARARAGSRALEEELESARAEQAGTTEQLARAMSGRRQVEQELERLVGRLEGLRGELQRTQEAHGQTEQALEQGRAQFAEQRERLERSLEEATTSLARVEAERRLVGDRATELSSRYDDRGTCLDASPAFCRLLGYEPGELIGRPGTELLHPDDRPRLVRARAARAESTFEARLRRKAGDFVWVEVSLHPVWDRRDERLVEIKTTVRDISEKHAAERGRRLAQAQFDSLFRTVPIGSALLGRDGRLERANPALCRLTGYSREQLEGTLLVTIVDREDPGSCSTGLRRVASGEVGSLRLERQLVHRSGRTIPVELSVTPLTTGDTGDTTDDPRLRGLVAHFQDLTERTRERDEVRRLGAVSSS